MHAEDTSPEFTRVQLQVWQRMTGPQRLLLAMKMSDEARELARDGIRARHPEYDPQQVEWAFRRLTLGDELFQRAWPHGPLLPP